MVESLLDLLHDYREWAILLSISVSILVAILGVLPSYFITGANLIFFGFWFGLFLSFIGEALGAIVAFLLYRMGFKRVLQKQLEAYPRAQRLINARGREAFLLVLSLRLLPFMPSGVVTFGGAVGQISFLSFAIASSIGKVPALLFEAFAVYQVTEFTWAGKLLLAIAGFYFIYLALRKINQTKN